MRHLVYFFPCLFSSLTAAASPAGAALLLAREMFFFHFYCNLLISPPIWAQNLLLLQNKALHINNIIHTTYSYIKIRRVRSCQTQSVRTWKDLNHKTEAISVICLTSPSLHTHWGHFFSHFWGVSAFSSALSSAVPPVSLSVCKLIAICWIQSLLLPQRLWKWKPWAWTSRSLFCLLCFWCFSFPANAHSPSWELQ